MSVSIIGKLVDDSSTVKMRMNQTDHLNVVMAITKMRRVIRHWPGAGLVRKFLG